MALIQCPDCGKEFSDSAKECPNCGYKKKKTKNINFSLIGGWILTVIGFLFTVWITFIIIINPWFVYFNCFPAFFMLILGIAAFIIGCFLISKKYGKKIKKISFIVGGLILLLNIIIAPINYNSAAIEDREYINSRYSDTTQYYTAEESANPNTSDYYIGTWEYTQPNNQDGVKSVKLVVNPDETVQALINVKGKEITVYGSWDWLANRIWMTFNDTEEHINGILYIDHLRIFKGYNDYFGIKYGQIKRENGTTYLYEDSSDAEAKNPNKRVELTKIN